MSRLGADADALDILSRDMATSAQEITSTAARLDRVVRSADWHGRDADEFRGQWRRHNLAIHAAVGELRKCSANLGKQAQQQKSASDAEPAPVCAAPPSSRAVLNGTSIPHSVEEWSGDVRAGFKFVTISGEASGRIEDHPGPYSLVTVGSGMGAGLTASAGSGISLDLGDTELGGFASASVSAGLIGGLSHSWVVRDRQAEAVLRDRTIEHVARSATVTAGIQNPILGAIASKGADLLVDWETPDATTTYAGLVIAGSAMSMAGITGAAADGELSAVLATNELRDGRRSYSLTAEGAASAALFLGMLGIPVKDSSLEYAGRSVLSIGTPQGGRVPVTFQSYGESDGGVTSESRSVVLSTQRLGGSVDDVVRQIMRGDPAGAADHLKSAVVSVGEPQVRAGEFKSDDAGLRASAEGVGLTISGTHRTIEFDPADAGGS